MKFLLLLSVLICTFCSIVGKYKPVKSESSVPPYPRPLHACGVVGDYMYIYGGRTGVRVYDRSMHSFSLKDLFWKRADLTYHGREEDRGKPPTLAGHSMSVVKEKLYIFGGRMNLFNYSNEIYVYDEHDVLRLITPEGEKPSARQGQSAVVYENLIYYFGGSDKTERFSDVFTFDVETNSWSKFEMENAPALEGHESILYGDVMYVFGGYDGKKMNEFVYWLDLKTLSWTKSDIKMKPRTGFTASVVGNFVYLFGGMNVDTMLDDTKIFNLVTKSFIKQEVDGKIPARYGHCAVTYKENVYIFGGSVTLEKKTVQFNDMYQLFTGKEEPEVEDKRLLSEKIQELITRVQRDILGYNATSVDSFMEAVQGLQEKITGDTDLSQYLPLEAKIKLWGEIGRLYERMMEVAAQISEITSPISFKVNEFSESRMQYDEFCKQLVEYVKDLEQKLDDLMEKEREVVYLEETMQSLLTVKDEITGGIALLTGSVDEKEKKVAKKKRELLFQESSIDKIKTKIGKLDDDFYQDTGEKDPFETQESGLLDRIQELTEKLSIQKASKKKVEDEITSLSKELADCKNQDQKRKEMQEIAEKLYNLGSKDKQILNEFNRNLDEFMKRLEGTDEKYPKPSGQGVDGQIEWVKKVMQNWEKLQSEKEANLKAELSKLEGQLIIERKLFGKFERSLTKQKSQLIYLQSKIKTNRDLKDSYEEKRDKLEAELKNAQKEIAVLADDIRNLGYIVAEQTSEIKSLKENLAEKNKDILSLEKPDAKRKEKARAEFALQEKFETMTRVVEQATQISLYLETMLNEIDIHTHEYDEKRQDVVDAKEKLTAKYHEVDEELITCRDQNEALGEENEELKAENEKMKEMVESLEKELAELKKVED